MDNSFYANDVDLDFSKNVFENIIDDKQSSINADDDEIDWGDKC